MIETFNHNGDSLYRIKITDLFDPPNSNGPYRCGGRPMGDVAYRSKSISGIRLTNDKIYVQKHLLYDLFTNRSLPRSKLSMSSIIFSGSSIYNPDVIALYHAVSSITFCSMHPNTTSSLIIFTPLDILVSVLNSFICILYSFQFLRKKN